MKGLLRKLFQSRNELAKTSVKVTRQLVEEVVDDDKVSDQIEVYAEIDSTEPEDLRGLAAHYYCRARQLVEQGYTIIARKVSVIDGRKVTSKRGFKPDYSKEDKNGQ